LRSCRHANAVSLPQIVIGGRNKYLINGHVAQPSRVQTMFHSVQLNVNNPHFLIMQGRITKVPFLLLLAGLQFEPDSDVWVLPCHHFSSCSIETQHQECVH
jgi:hypothetical protein